MKAYLPITKAVRLDERLPVARAQIINYGYAGMRKGSGPGDKRSAGHQGQRSWRKHP